ncbi:MULTISPECIES: sugar-binding domain-containing protein [unclassified Streptomyces]|uniref:sugar-binding domain-containing protein n=1 Tax=unclassified Streptomyces TaxID=2593676 RepID=UPI00336A6569
MIRTAFNDGWQARPRSTPSRNSPVSWPPFQPVTLPHDAMIEQPRTAPVGEVTMEGAAGAYFPGGVFEYRKTFAVPEEYRGKRIFVEFEGVNRDAMVYINGDYAGQRPYGYSRFRIDADRFLRVGEDNEIRVEARAHRDSRWYTGAGIYRDTWLLVGEVVRIAPDGLRVTTPDIDGSRAVVEVATLVANDSIAVRTVPVATETRDASGTVVASDVSKVTVLPGEPGTVRRRLYVPSPELWSPQAPSLYDCHVALGGVDEETVTFGIRTLQPAIATS